MRMRCQKILKAFHFLSRVLTRVGDNGALLHVPYWPKRPQGFEIKEKDHLRQCNETLTAGLLEQCLGSRDILSLIHVLPLRNIL